MRAERGGRGRQACVLALAAGASVLLATGPATAQPSGCRTLEDLVWVGGGPDAVERPIWWGSPSTGQSRSLSSGASEANSEPVASPDRTMVAWTGQVAGGGGFEVFVANADGTGVRRLVPGADAGSSARSVWAPVLGVAPAWAPDSDRLAWASADGRHIRVASVRSGTGRSLGPGSGYAVPAWAPDGRRLAWVTTAGLLLVRAVDADSPPSTVATDIATSVFSVGHNTPALPYVSWSPSADELATFTDAGQSRYGFARISIDSGAPVSGPSFANPDWYSGGSWPTSLAWHAASDQVAVSGEFVFVMTSPPFETTRDGVLGWILGVGGGVPTTSPETGDLTWSPDGSQLAGSAGEERREIRTLTPTGQTVRLLSEWPVALGRYRRDVTPAWSPDGARIAWESERRVRRSAWGSFEYEGSDLVVRRADAQGPLVVRGPGRAPVWSPSGTWIGAGGDRTIAAALAYPMPGGPAVTFGDPALPASGMAWTSRTVTDVRGRFVRAPSALVAGESGLLEIEVANTGPCVAEDVVVRRIRPDGATVAAMRASKGGAHGATWTIGRLAPGEAATLQIELVVAAHGAGTVVELDARITAVGDEATPADNDLALSVPVAAAPVASVPQAPPIVPTPPAAPTPLATAVTVTPTFTG